MEYSGLDREGEACVSSRILRGLGLTRRDLPKAMASAGLQYSGDQLAGSLGLLCKVSSGVFSEIPGEGEFVVPVAPTDRSHSAVFDLDGVVSSASPERGGVVVVSPSPVKSSPRLSWAYVVCRDGMAPPWVAEPPAVLLSGHGGFHVWYRESSDLVSSVRLRSGWDLPWLF